MLNYFLVFLISLLVAVIIAFPVLKWCKKLHLGQTILHYVESHASKQGTPTMGGIIFIFSVCISCPFFFSGQVWQGILCLLGFLGFGLLGFLDDFIKVKFQKNEGLKPYQKIVGQVGLSLIFALFVYFNVGSDIYFFGVNVDLGIFIIPFVVLFFVATTNSVNLIDGLDGLCTGVSGAFFIFFGVIMALWGQTNFALISFSFVGALLGFMLFNAHPAKIFMGDTGSLAIGGAIACLCALSKTEIFVCLIGLMYVLTALSDVIQVLHFKRTRKRIFLMAPLHHHFEKKGVNENRIVAIYIVITIVCGVATLLGVLSQMGAI